MTPIAAWHEWGGGSGSSSACVLQTCCTLQKADTGLLAVEGALSFFSVELLWLFLIESHFRR